MKNYVFDFECIRIIINFFKIFLIGEFQGNPPLEVRFKSLTAMQASARTILEAIKMYNDEVHIQICTSSSLCVAENILFS